MDSETLRSIPLAIYRRWLASDRVIFANDYIDVLTGRLPSKDSNESQGFTSLIHESDRRDVGHQIQSAIEQRRPYTIYYRISASSGEGTWVADIGHGVFNDQGELLYLEGAIADFSQRRVEERILQANLARYRALVQGSTDWMWSADPDGNVSISPEGKDFVGLSGDELNRDWIKTIHPDDRAKTLAAWRTAVRTQAIFQREFRIRYVDQTWRHVRSMAVPVQATDGEVREWIGSAKDITLDIEAERARSWLAAIVESADDAIIGQSLNGMIVNWNDGAYRTFGYLADEIVGTPLLRLVPPDSGAGWKLLAENVLAGNSVPRLESILTNKRGDRIPVSLTVSPVRDEQEAVIGLSCIARDISEQKENEQRLRDAKAAADAATRAKSAFLATMSHEIRTPLNGVIGMAELLLTTNLDARQRRYSDIVKSSASTLLNLINDILDFSKIEADRVVIEDVVFDLYPTIEGIMDPFARQAALKGVELICYVEPTVPHYVRGDPIRLRQIITNLVGNALKFTLNGRITVSARIIKSESQTHTIRFEVTDTGIGIDTDRLPYLFEPFSQADASTTRKFGGTGLGLSISKRFAELMGGHVGATSELGKGSTFWFDVPLRKHEKARSSSEIPAFLRSARVLAIDGPSTDSASALRPQLESWGIQVVVVNDINDASTFLQFDQPGPSSPVSILLVDQLPDGPRDIRPLSSAAGEHTLVSLLLVPIGEVPTPETLQNFGYTSYVEKPVHPSRLLDTIINSVLGRKMEAPPPSESVPEALPVPPIDKSILVAEDNEINQLVVAEILSVGGFACKIVGNGREVMDAIEREHFGLVLMDCLMPELDGFETTRLIRARERAVINAGGPATHLPIIALTANAIRGDRERCLEVGMDGYLTKPIDARQLLETVNSFLRTRNFASSQATPIQSREDAQILDLGELRQRCMSNEVLVNTLLAKFQSRATGMVITIQEALKANNMADARCEAHSLKGSAANLSAERIRQCAGEVELAIQENDLDGANRYASDLRAAVDEAISYITTLLALPTQAEHQQPSPPKP